jgi:hypothetical protein
MTVVFSQPTPWISRVLRSSSLIPDKVLLECQKSSDAFERVVVSHSESNSMERVDKPRPEDVLVGMGINIRGLPGFRRFHCLISSSQERYETFPKFEKTVISLEIVSTVKQVGGRFLQVAAGKDNGLVVMDDSMA